MARGRQHRLASPDETRALGASIALMLRPGDFVALTGPIGAGKTVLARAIIAALAGTEMEVPSPSFTLVQSYPDLRIPVTHFDLFRIEDAGETDELGIDEATAGGVALVEWADRMADALPADRLAIDVADTGTDVREATITGHGGWAARLVRAADLETFIADAGWGAARRSWLKGDASTRAYERLGRADATAIIMNAPKGADGPPVRDGKPYSRIAHLAEDVRAFVAVDHHLRALGLSAPDILAAEIDRGFLLIEDLGDALYGELVTSGGDLRKPYEAALSALAVLHDAPPPATLDLPGDGVHTVPAYDLGAFLIEAQLLTDWYWPSVRGMPCPDDARGAYDDICHDLFTFLGEPDVLALRDFHSPNLIWLPGRKGPAGAGLLDFQDALAGHPAYDLVSLAQDARVDLPDGFEDWLIERYLALRPGRMQAHGETDFRAACAVLGAQRAAKIAGIFTRLAERDGKRDYLRHIPRVVRYLRSNLRHPRLARLAGWFATHLDLGHEPARAANGFQGTAQA